MSLEDKLKAKEKKIKEKTSSNPKKTETHHFSLSVGAPSLKNKTMMEISVDKIKKPFTYQARKIFDDELISNIANSISNEGFLHNIIVVEDGKGFYNLVAGETRYKAAVMADIPTIHAFVFPESTSVDELIKISVEENTNRSNLSPFELYLLFDTMFKEERVKTTSDLHKFFSGSFSYSYLKKIMSFSGVHERIIEDAKNGKKIDLSVIVAIKSTSKKLCKKNSDLDADEVFTKFIMPIYNDFINDVSNRKDTLQKLASLTSKQKNDVLKITQDKCVIDLNLATENDIEDIILQLKKAIIKH